MSSPISLYYSQEKQALTDPSSFHRDIFAPAPQVWQGMAYMYSLLEA